jgi:hypothetical protein
VIYFSTLVEPAYRDPWRGHAAPVFLLCYACDTLLAEAHSNLHHNAGFTTRSASRSRWCGPVALSWKRTSVWSQDTGRHNTFITLVRSIFSTTKWSWRRACHMSRQVTPDLRVRICCLFTRIFQELPCEPKNNSGIHAGSIFTKGARETMA